MRGIGLGEGEMIYLEEFRIKQFRGIRNLELKDLADVNLIVGDNNSGKTSLLEAIMLMRNSKDFVNILDVARLREVGFVFPFGLNIYENFLNMFHPKYEKKIEVEGSLRSIRVGLKLYGEIEKVLIDTSEIRDFLPRKQNINLLEEETPEFQGFLETLQGDEVSKEQVKINTYTRLSGLNIGKEDIVDMVYVFPSHHTRGRTFSGIIKNENYKKEVLQLLQMFDINIEDMLYLRNEETGRPIECLKHKELGTMPLSTYGDGIKKVLLLASNVALAKDGILLIDEIETAIHSKYYNDIFRFVVKACKKYNIQLFATTHSIETVDGFLHTGSDKETGEYSEKEDMIRVVTFRKNSKKDEITARVLTGKEVFDNRRNFDFEVRI